MQIESVHIENFRSYKDETVPFNNYACLVGPNGAGKSTVLTALNVFFRESENTPTDLSRLELEDFHCKNTEIPIRITVTFCNLSEEAQDDFSDYVRQGRLVVTAAATFDEASGTAQVKQFGQRLGMTALRPFFEALGESKRVGELKEIYTGLRSTYPELPAPGSKDAMVTALRNFEAVRPDECELIPSEDQFYGFSKGRTVSQNMCNGFMSRPSRTLLLSRWSPETRLSENCLHALFVHRQISTRLSRSCARRCNNNTKNFSMTTKTSLTIFRKRSNYVLPSGHTLMRAYVSSGNKILKIGACRRTLGSHSCWRRRIRGRACPFRSWAPAIIPACTATGTRWDR